MIRAKMHPSGWSAKGKVGSLINLQAVYEGSSELQAISENSVFGNATPAGNLELAGDFPLDLFSTDTTEEYYVDIWADTDEFPDDALMAVPMRKVFQSEANPSYPSQQIQFRYSSLGKLISGQVYLSIANPVAIEILSDPKYDVVVVLVRLARGRRSDAEIAEREKLLINQEKHAHQWVRTSHKEKTQEEQEAIIQQFIKPYKIKLARARGEE